MKTYKAKPTIQYITLKQIIVLLVMIIVSYGCGRSQENIQLVERNGLFYEINSEVPYTGRVVGEEEGTWKDGKREGTHTWWHENGQKKREGEYIDGKPEGTYTSWHENGQKEAEVNCKNGNLDGPFTAWYENGQKKEEGTNKDGKVVAVKIWDKDGNLQKELLQEVIDLENRNGLVYLRNSKTLYTGRVIVKYPNGKKKQEVTYKDGKWDGQFTGWNENGQKEWECTYKDGEVIDRKRWDEEGNIKK